VDLCRRLSSALTLADVSDVAMVPNSSARDRCFTNKIKHEVKKDEARRCKTTGQSKANSCYS
jgi:hypothetical protein